MVRGREAARRRAPQQTARFTRSGPARPPRRPGILPPVDLPRPLRAIADAPATAAIFAAAIAATGVASLLGSLSDPDVLVSAGALSPARVWEGQWWRLGTALFVHAGPAHLALNVVFGALACIPVERALGTPRFSLLYAASGAAASACSLLVERVVSVGASGAVFGVLGAAIVLRGRARGTLRAALLDPVLWAELALLVAWTAAVSRVFALDHAAHAGGLAAGIAVALVATRRAPATRWPWAALALVLAAVLAVAVRPPSWYRRVRAVDAALRAERWDAARQVLAEAAARGDRSPLLEYHRAFLEVHDGDLGAALARLRPLAREPEGPLGAEAARALAAVAKTLGYRAATGDGGSRDPGQAGALLAESCAAGDRESCQWADALRSGAELVPAGDAPNASPRGGDAPQPARSGDGDPR